MTHSTVGLCPTCDSTGRRGYCAGGRCYCGHPACHAFASYIDLATINTSAAPTATPARSKPSRWDQRDHETWLDKD